MKHIHVDELYPVPRPTPHEHPHMIHQSTEDALETSLSEEDLAQLRSMDEQAIETLTRIQEGRDT